MTSKNKIMSTKFAKTRINTELQKMKDCIIHTKANFTFQPLFLKNVDIKNRSLKPLESNPLVYSCDFKSHTLNMLRAIKIKVLNLCN